LRRQRETAGSGGGARPWALLLPAVLWTLVFFLLPFAVMLAYSLFERQGSQLVTDPTFANYARLGEASYFQALTNSLEVTLLVTAISVLLAYPLAYALATQVPQRWQRLALLLAILPFWTSYVVRSYAWLLVLAENGVINQALLGLGLTDEPLRLANSRGATVAGFVHFFTMLLALTIYANLVQLSPNYRKAAADLGAGPFRTFLYVTLPLTLPGIAVGAFLTFVLTIGDYITPQILGGNRELLLPQIIMFQIGRRADFPLASALSMVLMLAVTLAYLAAARWLKLERA